MTTITVDETQVGQMVATDGMLISVTLKSVPTQYGNDYLSLTDNYYVKDEQDNDILAQELGLYHLHISTAPVSADSILFTNGKYRFANLVLKSIPPGCTIDIETGPIPAPPTLTSLSPDTAVSGDPDFVLSCIGTGFDTSTVIRFGDFDEPTTFVSDTEVTTIVKPSLFAPATVQVFTHEGPTYSDPLDFTFTAPVGQEARE
jgi:hypothetical protein